MAEHEQASGDGHQSSTFIELTVIVNGQPTEVKVNGQQPLRTVIPKALEQTGNVGQGPENWELKDAEGTLLDLDKKITDFSFANLTKLFLSLKAGVAGE
jgi:hypothetical protein